MKLSIIVCTKNRYERLKCVIKNIIDCSFKDWELIVVEGNSIDQTRTMLLDMYERGAIKYILNNDSRVKGRNAGLNVAEGEYVTFVDDDDVFSSNKFENQVKFLDENPDVDVVSCTTMFNQTLGIANTIKDLSHNDIKKLLKDEDMMAVCNFQSCVFRKSSIDKLFKNNEIPGYFYEEFETGGEGTALLYTMFFSGMKFANITGGLYIYRLGLEKDSVTNNYNLKYYTESLYNNVDDYNGLYVKPLKDRKKFFVDLYNKYKFGIPKAVVTEQPKKKRGRPRKNLA